MSFRPCSRVACSEESAATLTFDYADAMAVLGPLAVQREPHTFDLCARHARLTAAPQGWQLVRLRTDGPDAQPAAGPAAGPDAESGSAE
ncbi:DUF3499 family protein [Cryobacterium sandaracinum]|uniref:DUF3499 family protein n=1 Tax=Cryobacterium sandaracinum TaxID=1259247 RepID=A0ABY2JH73_9MICO|nr:DUF3499 family protein [Cryobacterium sandaracinum]TFD05715.1 DUF3499 family protein [Cryobacterium sandaracinum]